MKLVTALICKQSSLQVTLDTIFRLLSAEKVTSNWTYLSGDLQLFNNSRKEMDARSGNGGHNRPARPGLFERATRGFIDSRQTFVPPTFCSGKGKQLRYFGSRSGSGRLRNVSLWSSGGDFAAGHYLQCVRLGVRVCKY